MLLLGLDQVGHGHGVRLRAGVGADLAHELVVRSPWTATARLTL